MAGARHSCRFNVRRAGGTGYSGTLAATRLKPAPRSPDDRGDCAGAGAA